MTRWLPPKGLDIEGPAAATARPSLWTPPEVTWEDQWETVWIQEPNGTGTRQHRQLRSQPLTASPKEPGSDRILQKSVGLPFRTAPFGSGPPGVVWHNEWEWTVPRPAVLSCSWVGTNFSSIFGFSLNGLYTLYHVRTTDAGETLLSPIPPGANFSLLSFYETPATLGNAYGGESIRYRAVLLAGTGVYPNNFMHIWWEPRIRIPAAELEALYAECSLTAWWVQD